MGHRAVELWYTLLVLLHSLKDRVKRHEQFACVDREIIILIPFLVAYTVLLSRANFENSHTLIHYYLCCPHPSSIPFPPKPRFIRQPSAMITLRKILKFRDIIPILVCEGRG